jgi:hypothetical protein
LPKTLDGPTDHMPSQAVRWLSGSDACLRTGERGTSCFLGRDTPKEEGADLYFHSQGRAVPDSRKDPGKAGWGGGEHRSCAWWPAGLSDQAGRDGLQYLGLGSALVLCMLPGLSLFNFLEWLPWKLGGQRAEQLRWCGRWSAWTNRKVQEEQ